MHNSVYDSLKFLQLSFFLLNFFKFEVRHWNRDDFEITVKNTTDFDTTATGDFTMGKAEDYNHYWDNGFTIHSKALPRIQQLCLAVCELCNSRAFGTFKVYLFASKLIKIIIIWGANHSYSQLRAELRRTRLQHVCEAGMPATSTHYYHGAQPKIESV